MPRHSDNVPRTRFPSDEVGPASAPKAASDRAEQSTRGAHARSLGEVGASGRPSPPLLGNDDKERQRLALAGEVSFIRGCLRRLRVKPEDLADLSEEVLVRGLESLNTGYDVRQALRPWLMGIAFRVAMEFRRRWLRDATLARVEVVREPQMGPDLVLESWGRDRAVSEAISRMSTHRRPIFLMAEIDGLTMPEIVVRLAIPVSTGYTRLRAARRDFELELRRILKAR
jgi:RNA polymerase sigma-70 factor, ECF subfamily